MKNAPTKKSSANVPDKDDYTPGRYVERPHTFAASVLAALLEGKELTARETGRPTQLSQAVELLAGHYGWRIDARDVVIDVYAGRPTRFTSYSLNAKLIIRAHKNGAGSWRRTVKLVQDIMAEARQYRGYYGFSHYGKVYPAGVDVLMALRKQLMRRKG
jgi:hypothetical protein